MVIVDWFCSMNAKIRIEYIEFGSLVKKTQLFCAFAGYVFLDYMSFQTIYLYRSDFFNLCLFRLYLFKLIVFKIYVFSDCVFSDFVFADNTNFGRHEHFFLTNIELRLCCLIQRAHLLASACSPSFWAARVAIAAVSSPKQRQCL